MFSSYVVDVKPIYPPQSYTVTVQTFTSITFAGDQKMVRTTLPSQPTNFSPHALFTTYSQL